jgi:membrane associated rhomboid family serine protease
MKGCKLGFFLVLLPVFLSGFHLCYVHQQQGILLVEALPSISTSSHDPLSTSSFGSITGIYWNSSPQPQLTQFQQEQSVPTYWRQELSSHWLFPSWPSVSQAASLLVHRDASMHGDKSIRLEYVQKQRSYCFLISSSQGQTAICPILDNDNDHDHDIDRFSPPALGQWKVNIDLKRKVSADTTTTTTLRIRSFHWFGPYYFQTEEKTLQQLLQRPATCLLLAVNVALAFLYWNARTNPNTVALMDGPMLQQYQYWRAFTGSLAHFEWWHLLFNMMSLHNLGQFLEQPQYYPSIPFLLYNLALIPLTVLIFLGGTQLVSWIQVRRQQARTNEWTNAANTSISVTRPGINAVGYSGVLFAWMVVSSLEQPKSCPIPFFTQVCFDTWELTPHVKFNIGPLIQLVIAQAILPRVSLGGHLAGVMAGFLLHWKLLPLEVVQPSVLIPILTLVQWRHRQLLNSNMTMLHRSLGSAQDTAGPRKFLDVAGIDDDEDDNNSNINNLSSKDVTARSGARLPCPFGARGDRVVIVGTVHLLSTLICVMTILVLGSAAMLSWGSSVLYSQIILLVQFYVCYQAYTEHWDVEGEQDQWSPDASQKKQRMLILWKGFITSCILVILLESMTLTSWMLMGAAMYSSRALLWAALLLGSQIAVHGVALCVAGKHWGDIGGDDEDKGIFEYLFGYCVLGNASAVGHKILSIWAASSGCQRGLRRASWSTHNQTIVTTTTPTAGKSSSQPGQRMTHDKERTKILAAAAAERRARVAQV